MSGFINCFPLLSKLPVVPRSAAYQRTVISVQILSFGLSGVGPAGQGLDRAVRIL